MWLKVETIWKNDIQLQNKYYQPHSLAIFLECTRQIVQTHKISCGWLLDVSACLNGNRTYGHALVG